MFLFFVRLLFSSSRFCCVRLNFWKLLRHESWLLGNARVRWKTMFNTNLFWNEIKKSSLKKVGKTKIQEMSASNKNIFVLNSNNKRLIVNELVTHTSHPIEFRLFSLNSEANNLEPKWMWANNCSTKKWKWAVKAKYLLKLALNVFS
jgi:hypothetical protein